MTATTSKGMKYLTYPTVKVVNAKFPKELIKGYEAYKKKHPNMDLSKFLKLAAAEMLINEGIIE